MGTVDPHKQYKSVVQILFDFEGEVQGMSREIMSLLRMDMNYIKEKNITTKDLFPEVWEFVHPFKERGSFKKEFKLKYKFPTDSEFSK